MKCTSKLRGGERLLFCATRRAPWREARVGWKWLNSIWRSFNIRWDCRPKQARLKLRASAQRRRHILIQISIALMSARFNSVTRQWRHHRCKDLFSHHQRRNTILPPHSCWKNWFDILRSIATRFWRGAVSRRLRPHPEKRCPRSNNSEFDCVIVFSIANSYKYCHISLQYANHPLRSSSRRMPVVSQRFGALRCYNERNDCDIQGYLSIWWRHLWLLSL